MTEPLVVPFHRPTLGDEEADAVAAVLRSGWIGTGPVVERFERAFATEVGARHAVAVSSCTAALVLSLDVYGVGSGDEVIVPTNTFVATFEAVVRVGATPILVDVDSDTGNLSLGAVEAAITPATRGVMAVHIAGHPIGMRALCEVARRHDLIVIEDAAHAVETTTDLGRAGTVGHAGCFSFYANKNMTTGEGGMITCADADVADRLRKLRVHGLSRDAWSRRRGGWDYDVPELGHKANMDDIAAAVGEVQLRRLAAGRRRRLEIVDRYDAAFADHDAVMVPRHPVEDDESEGEGESAWHLYVVRLRETGRRRRDAMIEAMASRGVGATVHYKPIHRLGFVRDINVDIVDSSFRDRFPGAEDWFSRAVSLPIFPGMTDDEVDRVVDVVNEVCREVSGDRHGEATS